MSNTQQLRRRIKSISNTRQITKAMELVAASKMRKAQNQVIASRPYARVVEHVLHAVGAGVERSKHPLLRLESMNDVKNVAFVLIAPDKGLAGSLVTNIMRETLQFFTQNTNELHVITVERKARDFILKMGKHISADFDSLQSPPTMRDTNPIARLVIDSFTQGLYDEVYIAYTHFINTVTQKSIIKKILPIENPQQNPEEASENEDRGEVRFEPSSDDILESLLPRYIEIELYQAVSEAAASEHSARMVAMKNASDNAKDIIYDLQLTYNTTRQGAITQELAEVTAGANAM